MGGMNGFNMGDIFEMFGGMGGMGGGGRNGGFSFSFGGDDFGESGFGRGGGKSSSKNQEKEIMIFNINSKFNVFFKGQIFGVT